jgi:hypothetical protein
MSLTTTQNPDQRSPGRQPPMKRFLLLGAERSGSTLLRLMLDHHPDLSCMFESDFMLADATRMREDWHFRHSGLRLPDGDSTRRDLIADFFRQRAASSRKPVIGATFHHGFEHLPELFSDAAFIHLLRDGRPVAASMVQMGWVGTTYHGARQWAASLDAIDSIRDRISPERWLAVRYEDLVTDPRRTLSRICACLGVPFSERMLSYCESTTYDPPDSSNADRWRQRMTRREIAMAESAAGAWLLRLGYPLLFAPAPAGPARRLWLRLEDRGRRARFNCRRYGAALTAGRKICGLLRIRCDALDRRHRAIKEAHIK